MRNIRETVYVATRIDYEEVDHGEMKTFSLTKQNQCFELAKKDNCSGK